MMYKLWSNSQTDLKDSKYFNQLFLSRFQFSLKNVRCIQHTQFTCRLLSSLFHDTNVCFGFSFFKSFPERFSKLFRIETLIKRNQLQNRLKKLKKQKLTVKTVAGKMTIHTETILNTFFLSSIVNKSIGNVKLNINRKYSRCLFSMEIEENKGKMQLEKHLFRNSFI